MGDVLVVQWLGVAMHVENHVRAAVLIVVEIHVVRIVQVKLHTSIITSKRQYNYRYNQKAFIV